jgi:hypothetical protein
LVDAVWGDTAPARAGQSLESLGWRLRKLLEAARIARPTPSVLRTEKHGYRLAVPPDNAESHRVRCGGGKPAGAFREARLRAVSALGSPWHRVVPPIPTIFTISVTTGSNGKAARNAFTRAVSRARRESLLLKNPPCR